MTLNPSAGYRRLEVQEYSGIAASNPIDVTAQNINLNGDSATDSVTSTSAMTTASGDLIFGVATQDSGTDTISAGTGFAQRVAVNNGSDNPMLTEDLVQSAPGSLAATFTLSAPGSYQAQMVAFKDAGNAGPSAPLAINSPNAASGTVGTAFSYQITATNSPTSFNATGLPAGLTVDPSTGLISGMPSNTGTSNVTLSATNANGTGTAALTLTINAAATPVITSASTTTGILNNAFSYQITATNEPTSFNATGLPAALTVDNNTGLISGVPNATGTFNVNLSATNASGTGTGTLSLTISRRRRH